MLLFFTCSSEHLILNLSRNWSRSKFNSTSFGKCLMQWVHYASSSGIFCWFFVGFVFVRFWGLFGVFFWLQLPIRYQDESEVLIFICESADSLGDCQSDPEPSFTGVPQLEWLGHSWWESPSFETSPLCPLAWSNLLNQSASTSEHQDSRRMLTNWRESSRQEQEWSEG